MPCNEVRVPCNEVRVKGFYCGKLRENFKVLCQAYSGRSIKVVYQASSSKVKP